MSPPDPGHRLSPAMRPVYASARHSTLANKLRSDPTNVEISVCAKHRRKAAAQDPLRDGQEAGRRTGRRPATRPAIRAENFLHYMCKPH